MNEQCIPISEINVLNAGLVALMEVSGTDLTPVQAARTSYRDFVENHTDTQNEGLVDYLIRKKHGTPIEFPDVTFYMVIPIFVARQLVRNRIGISINEESLRYVSARDEYWIPTPEECRKQSYSNKQGSALELVDNPEHVIKVITKQGQEAHEYYIHLRNDCGLSKEAARTVLPLGLYTGWYIKYNIRSLFTMLTERLQPEVQVQTCICAEAMASLAKPHFPILFDAFENHVLNAVTFSADEMKFFMEYLFGNDIIPGTMSDFLEDLQSEGSSTFRKTRMTEFIAKFTKEPIVIIPFSSPEKGTENGINF